MLIYRGIQNQKELREVCTSLGAKLDLNCSNVKTREEYRTMLNENVELVTDNIDKARFAAGVYLTCDYGSAKDNVKYSAYVPEGRLESLSYITPVYTFKFNRKPTKIFLKAGDYNNRWDDACHAYATWGLRFIGQTTGTVDVPIMFVDVSISGARNQYGGVWLNNATIQLEPFRDGVIYINRWYTAEEAFPDCFKTQENEYIVQFISQQYNSDGRYCESFKIAQLIID